MEQINPIIRADYPDPDVIRVGDTYYMVSTTMHFFPGAPILRSYDLMHWEIASYVFDRLEDTPGQCMEGEQNIYGKGMWAASLRYHKDLFYVSFSTYDTAKTYLYTAEKVEGPWTRQYVEGVYHHNSILFDEDGKIYFVYGMDEIHITEMRADLTGPMEGGLDRVILKETKDVYLGYEGSHIMKKDGSYYLTVLNWPKEGSARRTQYCFRAKSLTGEFEGCKVFDDDLGYENQGVAQGGLVDTPDGEWYSVMFQDRGAAGRMPILIPVEWKENWPVYGSQGHLLAAPEVRSTRPAYTYAPLYTSDDFRHCINQNGEVELNPVWQWNHEPDWKLVDFSPRGGFKVKSGKISINMTQASNMLTQRMMWPLSSAEVTLEFGGMKNGDYAGLCALQGCYGFVGVTKDLGRDYLVMVNRRRQDVSAGETESDYMPGTEQMRIPLTSDRVQLRVCGNFTKHMDRAVFYYKKDEDWIKLGEQDLVFKLDHFMGCRYGLFLYSTNELGGEAVFKDFIYNYPQA